MLKVNSNLMTAEAEELAAIASQTETISNAISNVNSNMKWNVSGSSSVRSKLQSYSNNLSVMSQNMSRLSVVLVDSASAYEQTESGLYLNQFIIEPAVPFGSYINGNTESTFASYSDIGSILATFYNLLVDEHSELGNLDKITDYIELFTGNEFLQTISEYAGELKDMKILEIAGYLDDGKNFLEAWFSGDAETVEGLADKYGIELMKGLTLGTTLSDNIVGKTYINLAWNAGKNFAESVTEFVEDPSMITAVSAVWLTTAGSFFDTGTDLGKSIVELSYSIIGKEFDGDDYAEAMECLGSLVNPISYITGENKEYVEAFSTVMSEAASNTVKAVENTASTVANVVAQGVTSAGNYLIDGAVSIGNTVASWFGW